MFKAMKKVLVGVIAASLMLTSVAFAAESPVTSAQPVAQTKVAAEKANSITATVTTTAKGTATITSIAKTTKKSITVASKVTVKGVKYDVKTIGANAFKKCSKVKTVTLPSSVTKFDKGAFTNCKTLTKINFKGTKSITMKKGAFSTKDSKKVTIVVNKKMSAKELKKFKAALKAAGFKGKVKKATK